MNSDLSLLIFIFRGDVGNRNQLTRIALKVKNGYNNGWALNYIREYDKDILKLLPPHHQGPICDVQIIDDVLAP